MRSIGVVAVVVIASLAGTANAGGDLAHTQDVIGRHAARAKRGRLVAGAVATTSGLAVGIAGGFMLASIDEGAFLSGLEKSLGYTMVGLGSVLAVAGPLLMFRRTELEDMRDGLNDEQDARHVRTVIAARSKDARRTRRIMRGVGAALAGLGGASTLLGVLGGDSVSDVRNDLIGAGICVGGLGAGLAVTSFLSSGWDDIGRELGPSPVPTTAGIVPVRGGLVAGIGGAF